MERMNGRPDDEVVTDFDQTNDQVHGLGGDDGGDIGADRASDDTAGSDVLDGPDEWVPMAPQQQGVVWPLVAGLGDDGADGVLGVDGADGEDRGEADGADARDGDDGLSETDRDPAVTSYGEEGRP
jgi:hypothetical protein